jgi:hypothetical protein
MSADRKKYFHTMRQIADAWAARGWSTDTPLDEFTVARASIPDARDFERILLAGVVAHLGRIDDHLKKIEPYLWTIREILWAEPEPPAPRRDPIADAIRDCAHDPGRVIGPVDARALTYRARDAIRQSGCVTPGQLARYGAGRLSKIRGVGRTTVDEIRRFLRENYDRELAD